MIIEEKRKIIRSLRKYCLSHYVESGNQIGCVPIIFDKPRSGQGEQEAQWTQQALA
jgi:hypothetical protein